MRKNEKAPDAYDNLRKLCNDAAARAGYPYLEACCYAYALTVLEENKLWHRLRQTPDSIVSVTFTPDDHTKVVVEYRDRDWNTRTVRHP